MPAIGVYCVNCTEFGQLILRKISEIVAFMAPPMVEIWYIGRHLQVQ